jgi:hypothetical protein
MFGLIRNQRKGRPLYTLPECMKEIKTCLFNCRFKIPWSLRAVIILNDLVVIGTFGYLATDWFQLACRRKTQPDEQLQRYPEGLKAKSKA